MCLTIKKIMKNKTKNTEFIQLTELWQDGEYNQVGAIINKEGWTPSSVAEFCAYVNRFLGSNQLNLLYKFL
jgi:hypothetical protein